MNENALQATLDSLQEQIVELRDLIYALKREVRRAGE